MSRGPFFIHGRPALAALTAAGMLMGALTIAPAMLAQTSNGQPTDQPAGTTSTDTTPAKKGKAPKAEKVVQSKDTKKQLRDEQKASKASKVSKKDPLAGLDKDAPDKQLYDKAVLAIKSGRFDVARLDLQVLLNTYQDTQYQQQAKLAMADSWFKEGGTAALDQAEAEYKDFITFFPNTPEAAEAQMRVGDIYFREMDKVDRDDSKAEGAQREYRIMLQQFPDAPKELTEQATQRLRDVQEMLAGRMAETAAFYAGHDNRGAAMARYQTVLDTYPLYSHTDEALIAIGDLDEAQARYIRAQPNIAEGPKAILEKAYHDKAAEAYTKVVLEHAAAARVEDAKDRLAAMNRPIPTPTAEQLAASTALENSRASYTIANRAELLFLHKPDVVQAAHIGTPTLTDPKPTLAPEVIAAFRDDFNNALRGIEPAAASASQPAAAAEAAATDAPATAGGDAGAGTLTLHDVPTGNGGSNSGSSTSVMTSAPTGSSRGTSVGMRIVTPATADPAPAATPATPAPPAAKIPAALAPVGPTNNTTLPPIEKAAAAPEQHDEVQAGSTPAAVNTTAANSKTSKKTKAKKPPVDTKSESSSKQKPKKGLEKLNPL